MTSNAITAILSLSFINFSQDFPEIDGILLTPEVARIKDFKKAWKKPLGEQIQKSIVVEDSLLRRKARSLSSLF
jgi:hypothetical protein